MLELMLGLDADRALLITTVVLLFYVVMGGAHADILTDGIHGAMMLALGVVVIVMTFLGFGIEGGFSGMPDSLKTQDESLMTPLNPNTPLYHS